jgi:hypothetical protein
MANTSQAMGARMKLGIGLLASGIILIVLLSISFFIYYRIKTNAGEDDFYVQGVLLGVSMIIPIVLAIVGIVFIATTNSKNKDNTSLIT